MAIKKSSQQKKLDTSESTGMLIPMKPPIHPLRRWLFEHQLTLAEFATKIGSTQGYLSEVMNGQKRPSLDWIDKVSAETGETITALHFLRVDLDGGRKCG